MLKLKLNSSIPMHSSFIVLTVSAVALLVTQSYSQTAYISILRWVCEKIKKEEGKKKKKKKEKNPEMSVIF